MFKVFLISNLVFIGMRYAFIKPYIICGIFFSIPNAWDPFFCDFIALNPRATIYINGYVTKSLILNSIRAQFRNQFFKSTPASCPPSISAMILSISSRNICSLATISLISALSLTISIFSLVSSCSTYVLTERL